MHKSLPSLLSWSCLIGVTLISSRAFAGFGLGDIAKGAAVTVTAESLNADLNGGSDFFASACTHYANALGIATNLGPVIAQINAKNAEASQTTGAYKNVTKGIQEAAAEVIKNKTPLTKEQMAEIQLGRDDMAKGITKWSAVGVALGVAASQKGSKDAALAASIPVATELLKELPSIKTLSSTMSKLSDAQKDINKELQKNEGK
jgi:hemoglobin-like flavoprotein